MTSAHVPLWRTPRKCYGGEMDLALAFEDSRPFRLTVDQYLDLIEQDVIHEGSKIELIEGMIVQMNAQASIHTLVVSQLAFRLHDKVAEIGPDLMALATPTIAFPLHNALDPDVAVVARQGVGPGFFPASTAKLLIEVSHTTLGKDLRVKRDIYARADVPEYWVVDVNKAEVHRFHDPRNGAYRAEPPIPLAGELRSLTMPDLAIDGSGIL